MDKRTRIYRGKIPEEIAAILDAARPTHEALADLERSKFDLERDPEFVADRLRADLVEDILASMRDRGMNKNQLAEKLGKSRQYVTRILNESDNFTLATVAQLACALDLRPWLNLTEHSRRTAVVPRNAPGPEVVELRHGDFKRENRARDFNMTLIDEEQLAG